MDIDNSGSISQGLGQAALAVLTVAFIVGIMLVMWLPLAKDDNYVTRFVDSKIIGAVARIPRPVLMTGALLGFLFGGDAHIPGMLFAVTAMFGLRRQVRDKERG